MRESKGGDRLGEFHFFERLNLELEFVVVFGPGDSYGWGFLPDDCRVEISERGLSARLRFKTDAPHKSTNGRSPTEPTANSSRRRPLGWRGRRHSGPPEGIGGQRGAVHGTTVGGDDRRGRRRLSSAIDGDGFRQWGGMRGRKLGGFRDFLNPLHLKSITCHPQESYEVCDQYKQKPPFRGER